MNVFVPHYAAKPWCLDILPVDTNRIKGVIPYADAEPIVPPLAEPFKGSMLDSHSFSSIR